MDKHPRKKDEEKKEETKKFFNTLHEFFEIIAPNLSVGAIAVFWALVERANYFGADFNDFFWCTDIWLMKRLGIRSQTTVARYIKELMKAKAIFCRRGKHKNLASYYYIPYPYNPKRRDNPMKIIERREKAKAKAKKEVRELIKKGY
ncbi:hypothetical protein ES707_06450 [subsurface metagenome]